MHINKETQNIGHHPYDGIEGRDPLLTDRL